MVEDGQKRGQDQTRSEIKGYGEKDLVGVRMAGRAGTPLPFADMKPGGD
jgi:hypothetical protein